VRSDGVYVVFYVKLCETVVVVRYALNQVVGIESISYGFHSIK
jgi:hypothetical protein